MDMFSALNALGSPEMLKFASELPRQIAGFERFLTDLVSNLRYIEAKLETLDNRSAFIVTQVDLANERLLLLMAASAVTPELHAGALAMAGADPRNQADGLEP